MKLLTTILLLFLCVSSLNAVAIAGSLQSTTYTTGEHLEMPESLNGIVPIISFVDLEITTEDVKLSIQKTISIKQKLLSLVPFLSPIQTFEPENPKYTIYIERRGSPAYVISFFIILWALVFLILRFIFGLCGGRKTLKNPRRESKLANAIPFLCQIGGFLIFFVFGSSFFYSSFRLAGLLEMTSDKIFASAEKQGESVKFVFDSISEINAQSTPVPKDTISDDSEAFGRPFHIGFNLDLTLDEVDSSHGNAEQFAEFYNGKTPSNTMVSVYFNLTGVVLLFSLVLAQKKKLETVTFILGFAWLGMSAASIFLSGKYISPMTLYIDICEETFHAAETGEIPPYGTGINSYLNCLSSLAHTEINSVKFDMTHAIYAAFLVYKTRYVQLGYDLEIKSTADIVPAYQTQVDQVLLDYGQIVQTLNASLAELDSLQNCDALYEFIQASNEDICYSALQWLFTISSSLVFLCIGFGIMSYGTSSASNVLQKLQMKGKEENQHLELVTNLDD